MEHMIWVKNGTKLKLHRFFMMVEDANFINFDEGGVLKIL
jgi:hypothetical protein